MNRGEDVANLQAGNAQIEMAETFFRAASDGDTNAIRNMAGFFRSISVDERNQHGWTAVMLAARNGHHEAVEFLLEKGADTTLMNKAGQNAHQIASFWNQHGVTKTINKFLKPRLATQLEFVNYFGTNSADRQSYRRKDVQYVESLRSLKSTRYVIFAELELLTTTSSDGKQGVLFLSHDQLDELKDEEYDIVYLGKGCLGNETMSREELEVAYFAINLRETPTEEQFPVKNYNGKFSGKGYITHLMGLRAEEAGVVSQARSLLAWHDRYRHCPTCGTETKIVESGYKRLCLDPKCRSHEGVQNTRFPRIDPVVIVLVVSPDRNKCLLGRQPRFPPRMYSCLAGFMEPGESVEDAARREVMEESGIKVGKLEYHSSQPWPFPSQLMIGLIGYAVTDKITIDQVELEDAKWFTRAEIAAALAGGFTRPKGLIVPPKFAIAHQLQKAWVQMSSNL